MRVAISGSSGLIGTALVPYLRAHDYDVVRLVRRPARAADEITWEPTGAGLDPRHLSDVDAVVHLAGVGLGDKRWSTARKAEILDSRLSSTGALVTALAAAEPRQRTLLSASAIGYYGNTGDRQVDESSEAGTGFSAEVCIRWEEAANEAASSDTRVVTMRTGLVLSRRGGLLGRLLPPFRAGVGGPLSNGQMWWSWITVCDEVRAMRFLLEHEDVTGPVNLVGPNPVRNADFTRRLGSALNRPAVMWVPSAALRLRFGELADDAILASQRVDAGVLRSHGFEWRHPTLDTALPWVLTQEPRTR